MQKFHLQTDELADILEEGFQDRKQRRTTVITHLSKPCSICRRALRHKTEENTLDLPVVRPGEQDAVVWALRREILMMRLGEVVLEDLRPAHGYWARKTREVPMAFTRLVLEESFEAELQEPVLAVSIAKETLRNLETIPTPTGTEGALYQDVYALALAHLADAQQEVGEFHAAEKLFRQARDLLTTVGSAASVLSQSTEIEPGIGEFEVAPEGLEVLATVEELRTGLDLAEGFPWQALDRLKSAGRFLSGNRIPGRWSEHLLRRGRVLSLLKRFSEAREVLADALTELPIPSSPRLQLEIVHHQAALELQDGDCGRTYGLLMEFKDLYLDHGAPLLKVQRTWLLARVAYLMRCDCLARPRLQQAFDGFQRLGREIEALHVLTDLIRCGIRMNSPPDDFLNLRKDVYHLLESSSSRQDFEEVWRKFLHEALEEGWSLPWMEGLLDFPPGSSTH